MAVLESPLAIAALQPEMFGTNILSAPLVDQTHLALFNRPGPYYGSYPSLSQWQEGYGSAAYKRALAEFFEAEPDAPITLYIHIPFCAKLCWYCICNIHISNNRDRIQVFADALLQDTCCKTSTD